MQSEKILFPFKFQTDNSKYLVHEAGTRKNIYKNEGILRCSTRLKMEE